MDNFLEGTLQKLFDNEGIGPGFSERELGLIANCQRYADGDPAGLPGHNLMIIISKLTKWLAIANRRLAPTGDENE